MSEKVRYLDMECAASGQTIGAGATEDVIGKTLGVLQEDGVYAFFVYLFSLQNKDHTKQDAKTIIDEVNMLLVKIGKLKTGDEVNKGYIAQLYPQLCSNQDNIYFVKETLEHTLIYARYHAKANEPKKKSRK